MSSTPLSCYVSRRQALLEHLNGAVGLVLSGDASATIHGKYKADPHFVYLTGISNEPGAALLLDPKAEDPRRTMTLFLKPLAPEMEAWDGLRDPLTQALRARLGFETVIRTSSLPRFLTHAARLRKRLACLHPFSVYDAPVSADLTLFRKVAERVLGCSIEDHTNVIPRMRAVKDEVELGHMRQAASIAAHAYRSAVKHIRPGVNERDIQRALESAWFEQGASANAYNPIVGGGVRSTVLHYNANDCPLMDGDLLLIDAGPAFADYACDVTRTYPINGRFSPRQREIYQLVLDAQIAAINAVKPGKYFHEIEGAARSVFKAAGMDDFMPHGIGHQLGLEVHDATPDGPLLPGMVITVEPGLYLLNERIGVRIEDDILVTQDGHENLTREIPKSPDDVEAQLRRA